VAFLLLGGIYRATGALPSGNQFIKPLSPVVTPTPSSHRCCAQASSATGQPLDAAILFAPVGDLVLPALAALDRGGTLAIAGIYLSDIPPLNYERHLFQERQLRSVTSNTRADAREFLAFAAEHKLEVTVHGYPLDAADQALRDLKAGRFDGAAVLIP